jgi:hypothetical protein
MKWFPVTTIVSTTATGYSRASALSHGDRANFQTPHATPTAKPAWRLGTAATGFENDDEVGEPMSMPENARSVSVSPTPASRGGAVGNCQWMTSEIAVATRNAFRMLLKPSRERK